MTDIVIIGGGVAGLSAGIYARMNGYSAAVYEMAASAGGNLCSWEREGCVIDNCVHWLTGTNKATPTYKMWEELGVLGEGVEIIQPETLYTCEYGGWRLSLGRDLDRLRCDMLSVSPPDSRETERFIRAVKVMQGITGIAGKDHDRGISKARLLAAVPLLGRYYRMTAGELAMRFRHPLLRRFIAGLLTERFGSVALLEVFSCFTGCDGDLPRGGSAGMAERMTARFRELGGELFTGMKAVRLDRGGRKISAAVFEDGTVAEGKRFIVTADPERVFGGLVDLPMPRRLDVLYTDPRLARFSSVHCAFSCAAFDPPFRGDLIITVPKDMRQKLGGCRMVAREFSHEPSFAPPGRTVIQTMLFTDEDTSKGYIGLKNDDPDGYAEKKERFSAAAKELLTRRFPFLADKLTLIDVWTPATYRRYTGAEIGSYMSFAFTSGYIPRPVKCRVRGTDNLYLAGQWLQPPGGLPIAAESGRRAIREIVRQDKRTSR